MNFSGYKTREEKAAPDGLRAAMRAQRSMLVKRAFESASGIVFFSYVVLFFVLLAMWLCGCSVPQYSPVPADKPLNPAIEKAFTNAIQGKIDKIMKDKITEGPPVILSSNDFVLPSLPSAVAQFHPIHRCTNCPPILPTTNIVVAWSYPTPGYNWAQFGDLKVRTNYLQVWYCPAPGGRWALWTNTTVSPVVLPCTNSMGLYGFQLAWL